MPVTALKDSEQIPEKWTKWVTIPAALMTKIFFFNGKGPGSIRT